MQVLRKIRRGSLAIAGLALVTTLAACGGGNDDGGPPPVAVTPPSNTPPASASANPLGFIAYVKLVVASSTETASPIDLTGFVAPTDDTGPFDTTI